MNKNYETKKNNAASVLTDELVEAFGKLDKAMTISQEVTDEYFNKLDSSDKEDRTWIVAGFSRAGIHASIVEDYVFEAKKLVTELVARSQNSIQEDVEEDIEKKRKFLQEKFPEMAEMTEIASNKAIELGFEMMFLDEEQRKEFEKFLIAKSKKDYSVELFSEAE